MPKYSISFNQNGDQIEIVDQVGEGIGPDVLWKFADLVAGKIGQKYKDYAVYSISQTDLTEVVRRPG